MTFRLTAALILLLGAFTPAVWLGIRGGPFPRLVGLQLGGALLVPVLLLLAVGYGQPSYLVVPLLLAVLSFVGTLVFVRLLGTRA